MTWNGASLLVSSMAREHLEWASLTEPPPFLRDGVAADWRRSTVNLVFANYRSFLGWLDSAGLYRVDEHASARITQSNVARYVEAMRTRGNKASTIYHRVLSLERVLAVVAPTADRRFLRTILNKLPSRGDVAAKRARLQETAVLYDLGVRLMRANHQVAGPIFRQQATIFRDGLQIALLSQRPLRRKNFVEMELKKHLRRDGGRWRLSYDEEETKNWLAIDCEIPVELEEWLEIYLSTYRPLLAGSNYKDARVWITYRHGAEAYDTIHDRLVKRTGDAFGKPVSPHLFRDALATSLAMNDPERIGIAHLVLGNSYETCQKYYNLAGTLKAGRNLANVVRLRQGS